jgi:hypothetical protein
MEEFLTTHGFRIVRAGVRWVATMRRTSVMGCLILLTTAVATPATAESPGAPGGEPKLLSAEQSARVMAKVLPKDGYTMPIRWGDLGVQLVRLGVIDLEKFKRIYATSTIPAYFRHLEEPSEAFITITSENAQFLVTVFWGLGLANRNPLLDKVLADRGMDGTMRLASTGGWTLGAKPAAELYGKFDIIRLTPEQQAMVSDLAHRIYRPCCDNPTALPDCNHGIALLGLIELMAANGLGRAEILNASLKVNAFWFPQHYAKMAMLFALHGTDWDAVDPLTALGRRYSSLSGWRQHVDAELKKLPQALPPQAGGSKCALPDSPNGGGTQRVHGLAFDPADPEVLQIAAHTGLVRIRQGAQPGWPGNGRVELASFAANPGKAGLVYASGRLDTATQLERGVVARGLLLSRDAGQTWQPVTLKRNVDLAVLSYSPREGGQLYGWSVAEPPGLYRIAVTTWGIERLTARGLSDVLSLAVSPGASGSLLAGAKAGLKTSVDGGLTWRSVAGIPGDAAVTAVSYHATDAQLVYAYVARADLGLMRSRDGGATWEKMGVVADARTPIAAIAVGPGDHVAIASTQADVVRSRDGARTWQWVLRAGQLLTAAR